MEQKLSVFVNYLFFPHGPVIKKSMSNYVFDIDANVLPPEWYQVKIKTERISVLKCLLLKLSCINEK